MQKDERTLLVEGKENFTEELVVIGKGADRSVQKTGAGKIMLFQLDPIFPADMMQIATAKFVRVWVPSLAVAARKNGTAAEFLFRQLSYR